MAWVSPRAWTVNEAATSAKMNEISSSLNVVGSAWTSYSPALTAATTDPTMGASVLTGRYRLTGKTVDIKINLTVGSGFNAGSGTWRISLPSGMTPLITDASDYRGFGTIRDVSGPVTYPIAAYHFSTTQISMTRVDTLALVGAGVPMVWATGDLMSIKLDNLEIA